MSNEQLRIHNSQFTIHNLPIAKTSNPPISPLDRLGKFSGQAFHSSTLPLFHPSNLLSLQSSTLPTYLLFILALLLVLPACGPKPLTPEQQIREYIFVQQPVTGPDFVIWADQQLAEYPSRRVYRAIYNQAQIQAAEGHPNAVATLSFAARAWAEEKNLVYNPGDWLAMQQQAIANLRDDPGQINLWPTSTPE